MKHERLNTPVGEARWAHVQEPKPPFDDKGEPKYCIDVVFDPADPQWKTWGADITRRVKESKGKHNPIRWDMQKDDKGNESKTGKLAVTFKTGVTFKPAMFDKYGRPLGEGVLVGNGSKVRVNFSPVPYEGFGGGIAMYLNAVQVLDLVPYAPKTADAFGFEVAEPPPAEEVMPSDAFDDGADATGAAVEEEVPPPDSRTRRMQDVNDDLPF